ncbi:hypothetical protein IWQ60_011161, partial [Tieghemiomyces parasiticus]
MADAANLLPSRHPGAAADPALAKAAREGARSLMQYLLRRPGDHFARKDVQKQLAALPWDLVTRTLDYCLRQRDHEAERQGTTATADETTSLTTPSIHQATMFDRWIERQRHFVGVFGLLLRIGRFKAQKQSRSKPTGLPRYAPGLEDGRYQVSDSVARRLVHVLLSDSRSLSRPLAETGLTLLTLVSAWATPLPADPAVPALMVEGAVIPGHILVTTLNATDAYAYFMDQARQSTSYAYRCRVIGLLSAYLPALVTRHKDAALLCWAIDLMAYPAHAHRPVATPTTDTMPSSRSVPYLTPPVCNYLARCALFLRKLINAQPAQLFDIPVAHTTALMTLWKDVATVILGYLPAHMDQMVPTGPLPASVPASFQRLFACLMHPVGRLCRSLCTNYDLFAQSRAFHVCVLLTQGVGQRILQITQPAQPADSVSADRADFLWLWWLLKRLLKLCNEAARNFCYAANSDLIAHMVVGLLKVLVAHRFERPAPIGASTTVTAPSPGGRYVPPGGLLASATLDSADPVDTSWGMAAPGATSRDLSEYFELADHFTMDMDGEAWMNISHPPTAPTANVAPIPKAALDVFGMSLAETLPLIFEILQYIKKNNHPSTWPTGRSAAMETLLLLLIQVDEVARTSDGAPLSSPEADPGGGGLDSVTSWYVLIAKVQIATLTSVRKFFPSLPQYRHGSVAPRSPPLTPHGNSHLAEAAQAMFRYLLGVGTPSVDSGPRSSSLPPSPATREASTRLPLFKSLRYEAAHTLATMAQSYAMRVSLVAAPASLVLLDYDLPAWLLAEFPGKEGRVDNYTRGLTNFILYYLAGTLNEAYVRMKFADRLPVARFLIVSLNSTLRLLEQPVDAGHRDVLQELLDGLFDQLRNFWLDPDLLRALVDCPVETLRRGSAPADWQRTPVVDAPDSPAPKIVDGVAMPTPPVPTLPAWHLSRTTAEAVRQCTWRDGTPRLSIVAVLAHVLRSWSTANQAASPGGPMSQPNEYTGPEARSTTVRSLPNNSHGPTGSSPTTATATVTTAWTGSRNHSYRDRVLISAMEVLYMVRTQMRYQRDLLYVVAQRWRDFKYDTAEGRDPFRNYLTDSAGWCLELANVSALTGLYGILTGLATTRPSEVRTVRTVGSSPASPMAAPSITVSRRLPPHAWVAQTWVPTTAELAPLAVRFVDIAVQTLPRNAAIGRPPPGFPTFLTLDEAVAVQAVYCSGGPGSESADLWYSATQNAEGNVSAPHILFMSSRLSSIFSMLLPSETLDVFWRRTARPGPIDDPLQPSGCISAPSSPTLGSSSDGSPHSPSLTQTNAHRSRAPRTILEDGADDDELASFMTGCQAIHFLAWQRQDEFAAAVDSCCEDLRGACTQSLPAYIATLSGLPGPLPVVITCEVRSGLGTSTRSYQLPDRPCADPFRHLLTNGQALQSVHDLLNYSDLEVLDPITADRLVTTDDPTMVTFEYLVDSTFGTGFGSPIQTSATATGQLTIRLPRDLARALSPAFAAMLD